jgi:cell division protein FtsB
MHSLPINVRRVAVIAGIFMLVFVVLEFNRRLEELTLLNEQNEIVRAQATQVAYTQLALQTKIAFANSTAAVEEWARTDGHYIQDGDLPIVPVGQAGVAPIQVSTPVPTATPMQNWEVWWSLFFGE